MLAPVPRSSPSFALRCYRALLSPWARFSVLVALLGASAVVVLLYEPQKLLADGWGA
ncbi:hypothetical protein GT002_34155, partial [Streptomyces sp. SID4917]